MKKQIALVKAGTATLVFTCLLNLSCSAHADAPTAPAAVPNTHAGKLLAAWLDAFNSGDKKKLLAYKKTHEPGLNPQQEMNFFKLTGGFDLIQVKKSEPNMIEVLIRERNSDNVLQADLKVKANKLRLLDDLVLQGAEAPVELMPQRQELDTLLQELKHKADAYAERGEFSGQFLVARNGSVLFSQNWGNANRETKLPITNETRFRIASMGKMFTAVAVLQLVDAGKVSLDKAVGDYLPDYPNRDIATKVTIRELLNHTGGTGDIFGKEFDQQRKSLREHSDYIGLYGKRGPEFEPGSRDGYSNYGFVLLGAIIEKVSGKSYYDYVQEKIFTPADMTSTGALPEAEVAAQLSEGYMADKASMISNRDTLPYRGTAAGGAYSTASDLLKFAIALRSGRLISPKLLEQASRPENHARWYGYGFMVGGEGNLRWFGHEGGAPGMNGKLIIYPELGYVVICLANTSPPDAGRLATFFANRMPL